MHIAADRVKETTTTAGTGAVSMGGAATGYQAFSSAFTTGDQVYYCIAGTSGWEVGVGTLTTGAPWTMSRDTVFSSSNAGALVTFGAESKDIFCTEPANVVQWRMSQSSVDTTGQMVIPVGMQFLYKGNFVNKNAIINYGDMVIL